MKFTVNIVLMSTYNDGAGAVGTYSYNLTPSAGRVITILDTDIWKLLIFNGKLPTSTLSLTAVSLGTTSGSPPAYSGRTCTVSSAGLITFTAASHPEYETPQKLRMKITPSLVPTHEYEHDIIMDHGADGKWATIDLTHDSTVQVTSSAPVEPVIMEDVNWAMIEGDDYYAQFTPCAADITAKLVRAMTMSVVEKDLLSREYQGSWVELGAKAFLSMARAKGKKKLLNFVALEVADYLAGDGPLDMYIPRKSYTVQMGA